MKPLLVGEMNPYGADPHFALYPAPDGCSGHRLCVLILGMSRTVYLDSFDRTNLCEGKWNVAYARLKAAEILKEERKLILLGSKVSAAFGCEFRPFEVVDGALVLPHPSRLCRLWGEPGAIEKARAAVGSFAPELAPLLGQESP